MCINQKPNGINIKLYNFRAHISHKKSVAFLVEMQIEIGKEFPYTCQCYM